MSDQDRIYFARRAAEEAERADRGRSDPEAAAAHRKLQRAYVERALDRRPQVEARRDRSARVAAARAAAPVRPRARARARARRAEPRIAAGVFVGQLLGERAAADRRRGCRASRARTRSSTIRGPPSDRAEFGGVADRLAHPGDAARLDQLGEQLQLADAFHVGDLGRRSRPRPTCRSRRSGFRAPRPTPPPPR